MKRKERKILAEAILPCFGRVAYNEQNKCADCPVLDECIRASMKKYVEEMKQIMEGLTMKPESQVGSGMVRKNVRTRMFRNRDCQRRRKV